MSLSSHFHFLTIAVLTLQSVNHQYLDVAKPWNTSFLITNSSMTTITIYHDLITPIIAFAYWSIKHYNSQSMKGAAALVYCLSSDINAEILNEFTWKHVNLLGSARFTESISKFSLFKSIGSQAYSTARAAHFLHINTAPQFTLFHPPP